MHLMIEKDGMTRLLRHTVHGTVEVRMDEFLNLLRVSGHGLEDVSCDFQKGP